MVRTHRGRVGLAIAGGLAAAALVAPAAEAEAAGVASGTTAIKLDAGTAKALRNAGVKLTARSGATRTGARVTLPVTGGRLDYETGNGRLTHRGGLRLSAGKRRVTLTRLELSRSALTARVGKGRIKVAAVSRSRYSASADFTGGRITRASLAFTARAAKAVNRALGVDLLERRTALGSARVVVQRQFQVVSGATVLVPDPATAQVLAAGGVSLAPVAPATAGPAGVSFPVTGGQLNLAVRTGSLAHSGGLSLTRGGTSLALTDPGVELARAATFSVVAGSLGRQTIADLDLGGARLSPELSAAGGELTIAGAVVRLNALAATALGGRLGITIPAGTALGVVTTQLTLR
jgi:hypothetical protein